MGPIVINGGGVPCTADFRRYSVRSDAAGPTARPHRNRQLNGQEKASQRAGTARCEAPRGRNGQQTSPLQTAPNRMPGRQKQGLVRKVSSQPADGLADLLSRWPPARKGPGGLRLRWTHGSGRGGEHQQCRVVTE